MKPGASAGRIPAKVSVAARASVTAGLANEVEAVNQYAAAMYAPTAKGKAELRCRAVPQMTARRPKVATASLNACAAPERPWRGAVKSASPNMACAPAPPAEAPAALAAGKAGTAPPGRAAWQ